MFFISSYNFIYIFEKVEYFFFFISWYFFRKIYFYNVFLYVYIYIRYNLNYFFFFYNFFNFWNWNFCCNRDNYFFRDVIFYFFKYIKDVFWFYSNYDYVVVFYSFNFIIDFDSIINLWKFVCFVNVYVIVKKLSFNRLFYWICDWICYVFIVNYFYFYFFFILKKNFFIVEIFNIFNIKVYIKYMYV